MLLFGAFAGLVADRSDKRKLLLIVQTFAMVQSFALAALAFQDSPPVWAIYVIAAFGGMATAFDNPARRSFVVEMVPEDHITNAVSLNSALMTGSRVIGPALGGLLVATVGFGWAFLLDGVSYVAVLVGAAHDRPVAAPPRAGDAARARARCEPASRYAWSIAELRVPLIMMAVIGTLAFNFQTVLPLFAVRDLDGQEITFSLLMSVVSVGSLVGALRSARRTHVSVHTVSLASLGFGASMLALAIAPNQPIAFAVGIVMGFTSISFMTASTAIVQLRADPMMRGRILALQAMVFLGSTPDRGTHPGWDLRAVRRPLRPRRRRSGHAGRGRATASWSSAATESCRSRTACSRTPSPTHQVAIPLSPRADYETLPGQRGFDHQRVVAAHDASAVQVEGIGRT